MRKIKITALLLVLLLLLIAGLAVACNGTEDDQPGNAAVSITAGSGWKNVYDLNEAFSPCTMTVTFADGTTRNFEVTADMLTGFDTSAPGVRQVTVTYMGISVEFSISVVAPAEAEKLYLDSWKSLYFVGDEINLSNAEIVIDGKEKVAVTEDMVSGFDTSGAGLKNVRIIYNGAYIVAEIVVVNRPQGVAEGEKSVIDRDAFLSELERLLTAMALEDEMDDIIQYEIDLEIISFFEAAGITDEEFKGMVDTAMSDNAALPAAVKNLKTILFDGEFESAGEMILAIADEVLQEDVLSALANTFAYIEGVIEPEDIVNVIFHGFGGIAANFGWTGKYSIWCYPVAFDSAYFVSTGNFTIKEAEVRGMFEAAGLGSLYDGYLFGSESMYYKLESIIRSAEMKVVAESLQALIDTISAYGVGTTAELLNFALDVTATVMDGDITVGELFAEKKYSYKDMVTALNLLGEIGYEVNRVLMSDPDFMAAALVVAGSMDEKIEDIGFDVAKVVEGISALDRTVFGLLRKVTPELMSAVYLDYDAWAKEEDETISDQKFGYMLVEIINFVAEEYNQLSTSEKANIRYTIETLVPDLFDIAGAEAFVDILNGWTIKDADSYSPEELKAVADEINTALDNITEDEGDNKSGCWLRVNFSGVQIAAGTPLDEIPVPVELIERSGNSTSHYRPFNSLAEFKQAGGKYTVTIFNGDLSQKGFLDIEITVEDLNYEDGYGGKTLYRGNSYRSQVYVYDDTSVDDFRIGSTSGQLVELVIPQGADIGEGIPLNQFYYDLCWNFVHVETGIEVFCEQDLQMIDGNGKIIGIDTSAAVGLYAVKLQYTHKIFGVIEIPMLCYICDPQDTGYVTGVYNYYAGENQIYSDAKLLKGAEYDFYAEVRYSYVIRGDKLPCVVEGFDPDTVGTQTVTLYPEGYPELAKQFDIEIVEMNSLGNIYIDGLTGNFKVPVNGTIDDVYVYDADDPGYADFGIEAEILVYFINEYGNESAIWWTLNKVSSFREHVAMMKKIGIDVTIEGLDTSSTATDVYSKIVYKYKDYEYYQYCYYSVVEA